MNYKDCDKLWKQVITKQGKCEKCGATTYVQAHHIIPRTCWPLRYDLENGVALCRKHHLYWAHKNVLDFFRWIEDKRDLKYLEDNRHRTAKNDYTAIYLYLKTQL